MAAEWHPKQELESIGAAKPSIPKRADRVADVIRNELSVLMLQRIRDPKLSDVSISRVELSDDLRHAKIYFTILGNGGESKSIRARLEKASGFMRSHLAKTLNLRFTPDLRFWYDKEADKAREMEQLLADIARERDERSDNT
jgi:ribosome-binding factor A